MYLGEYYGLIVVIPTYPQTKNLYCIVSVLDIPFDVGERNAGKQGGQSNYWRAVQVVYIYIYIYIYNLLCDEVFLTETFDSSGFYVRTPMDRNILSKQETFCPSTIFKSKIFLRSTAPGCPLYWCVVIWGYIWGSETAIMSILNEIYLQFPLYQNNFVFQLMIVLFKNQCLYTVINSTICIYVYCVKGCENDMVFPL